MAGNEEGQSLLVKMKEESEEADLKLNLKKKKKQRPWHPVPSLHDKGVGKKCSHEIQR